MHKIFIKWTTYIVYFGYVPQLFLQELRDELYQKIAAEMNLSETVFITTVKPSEDFAKGQMQ